MLPESGCFIRNFFTFFEFSHNCSLPPLFIILDSLLSELEHLAESFVPAVLRPHALARMELQTKFQHRPMYGQEIYKML